MHLMGWSNKAWGAANQALLLPRFTVDFGITSEAIRSICSDNRYLPQDKTNVAPPPCSVTAITETPPNYNY